MAGHASVAVERDDEVRSLRAALAEAERRSAARAELVAITSHELREPMNGVLGMARLLRETVLDDEQRSYVETIVGSAETLLTVINDVLDLSRVDAGRLEIVETPFEFAPLLARLETLMAPRARQKGLSFGVGLADGLPRAVRGDPGRLRQVLLNLVGNAVKFTERGGVEVVADTDGPPARRLRLVVRDTGPGIEPAALERLFTAFVQADATVGRIHGGSGLGLMIARRLTEAMGGELRVESDLGRGTRFVVELPLLAESGADTPAAGVQAELSLAGASLLVVDPQRRIRQFVQGVATGWGMTARAAERGGEALLILRDAADRGAAYDFVVCDRELPDIGGEALARSIRAEPGLAGARLVMLVASGIRGDAMKASAAGFDAYLQKPVRSQTLLDCLRRLRLPDRGSTLITAHSLSDDRPAPLCILLVDDNAVNVRLASILLERAGHRVLTATDGAAAVEVARSNDLDLVLMDVQMPVMDGLEATRRIRALPDPQKAGLPIVAVTANALEADVERCRQAGMIGHVGKPFDRAALLDAVDRWGRDAA
ncbi:MAG TPA: response regulator [Geminicoccaceae bacterium]|nr:response regulator [Geminicoccus sp.]HMU49059.1 response regulator [Geminicoccaceae bacterium]